jgi:hypothetical protein
MKLTDEQIEQLENKDWQVKPEGCYLELYKEDYCQSGWEQMCEIIGNSVESNSVKVLIFGFAE